MLFGTAARQPPVLAPMKSELHFILFNGDFKSN